MKVIRGIQSDILPASVVTLGMFDGVHPGHRALLQSCRRHADLLGLPAVVLTYEPHPTQILRPDQPVRLLTPLDEKIDHLARAAMDAVVIPQFTREFSQMTPDDFIREILVSALHPVVVVAGYRTTFGHARAGNADVLRELGGRFGFTVEIVEPVEVAGGPVSSSRIRLSLEHGDVVLAAELLGYPYQLIGEVVHGDARGRQLGIPTANLQVPENKLVPADGVYAVEVTIAEMAYRGVMNIGNRPTFDRPYAIEVHLIDFHGELYGQTITVSLLARLRDTRPFDSLPALIEQIQQDIARARR